MESCFGFIFSIDTMLIAFAYHKKRDTRMVVVRGMTVVVM